MEESTTVGPDPFSDSNMSAITTDDTSTIVPIAGTSVAMMNFSNSSQLATSNLSGETRAAESQPRSESKGRFMPEAKVAAPVTADVGFFRSLVGSVFKKSTKENVQPSALVEDKDKTPTKANPRFRLLPQQAPTVPSDLDVALPLAGLGRSMSIENDYELSTAFPANTAKGRQQGQSILDMVRENTRQRGQTISSRGSGSHHSHGSGNGFHRGNNQMDNGRAYNPPYHGSRGSSSNSRGVNSIDYWNGCGTSTKNTPYALAGGYGYFNDPTESFSIGLGGPLDDHDRMPPPPRRTTSGAQDGAYSNDPHPGRLPRSFTDTPSSGYYYPPSSGRSSQRRPSQTSEGEDLSAVLFNVPLVKSRMPDRGIVSRRQHHPSEYAIPDGRDLPRGASRNAVDHYLPSPGLPLSPTDPTNIGTQYPQAPTPGIHRHPTDTIHMAPPPAHMSRGYPPPPTPGFQRRTTEPHNRLPPPPPHIQAERRAVGNYFRSPAYQQREFNHHHSLINQYVSENSDAFEHMEGGFKAAKDAWIRDVWPGKLQEFRRVVEREIRSNYRSGVTAHLSAEKEKEKKSDVDTGSLESMT